MSDERSASSAKDYFHRYLLAKGMRRTAERDAILAYVVSHDGHHTAESVCEALAVDGLHLSQATVYSTLALLVDCELLVSHSFEGHSIVYELASVAPHHHLVCTRCGKVKEARNAAVDAIVAGQSFRTFAPHRYSLTLYGICSTCQRRERKSKKNNKQT